MPSIASSGSAAAQDLGGSSAAVLEFVCLFTHDLKRKQKRWQDGRLKYHTFNKRVMVHDERGNFVGDMHWNRDWEFDEGEEVELERGGVIVQVAECVGSRNQDLTELLDKRAKEKEERQLKAASRVSLLRPPIQSAPLHRIATPRDHFQTRHRPLHQVIGTPTGHHGRAVVPTESPFEQRQNMAETPESRPPKRRKYDITPPSKLGYAQSLFGAPLTLSAVPMSSAPRRQPAPQQQPRPEVSSSPDDRHGRATASSFFAEIPEASLPRLEPGRIGHTLRQRSRAEGRDRDEPRHDEPHGGVTTRDGGGMEQERSARPAPGYGSSRHFNGPSVKDNISPARSDIQADKSRKASKTAEAQNGATDSTGRGVGAAKKKESAIIILDDDAENTPLMTEEVHKTREAGNGASLQVADKKKRSTKRKKTPPRSPSPLGESVGDAGAPSIISDAGAGRPKEKEKRTAKRKKTPPPKSPPPLGELVGNVVARSILNDVGAGESKDKEKRTELRLKSRQKRGLMVAAEIPKRTKRPKLKKSSTECSAAAERLSDKTAGHAAIEESFASGLAPARKQPSLSPEEDDPVTLSPGAPMRPSAVDHHPRSPSPPRTSANDLMDSRGPAPEEDDDPFADSPIAPAKVLPTTRPARSPSPLPSWLTGPVNGLASSSPHRAFVISTNLMEDNWRRPTEAVYDVPDDTDDEYFGILPTPVPPPNQRRANLTASKAKTAKVPAENPSIAARRTQTRNASPGPNTPLDCSPSADEARSAMRTCGTGASDRQSESEEEVAPRARRSARRIPIDDECPQVPVGPRLARLGRNIRSKEVIGFNPPPSSPVGDQRNPPITSSGERGPDPAARDVFPTARNSSPDPHITRGTTSVASQSISQDADKPPALVESEVLAAVVPRRSDTASAGPGTASLLRPQSSLPETARAAESNEQVGGGDKPAADAANRQASRPGLTRQRSVVTPRDYETDGNLALIMIADRMVRPADLLVPGSRSTKEDSTSAGRENDVQTPSHQTDDLPQHRLKPKNATCGAINAICATGGGVGGAASEEPANVPSNPPPRIANPATRGRKAALKSHAAGQVPQSILPPTEPLPARPVVRLVPDTRLDPSGNERPKRKMTFPGFMSAKGGGPWSREAHDLLERGRPP